MISLARVLRFLTVVGLSDRRFDVAEAADSDEFFLFEELLSDLMLALSRDAHVAKHSSIRPTTAPLKTAVDSSTPACFLRTILNISHFLSVQRS